MNDESPAYTTPAIQTLYRVYRPTTFDTDELVGQDHVAESLKRAIKYDRVAHAYLFCGPRGTGKTSTARLLAKAANCLYPDPDRRPCNACANCRAITEGRTLDIVEIDAASNRGIDEIRALRDTVQVTPAQLKYRFYIIDECHQLTPAAWNAFLKTLEEPPPHAKFVLCTTEPEKLLDTVASRCQRFDFHRIGVPTIVALMRAICGKEGLAVTDEALEAIARQATGSMRDALSLLDTLAAYGTTGEGITLDTVRTVLGAGSNERVLAVVDALAANDIGAGIAAVNAAAEAGVEPGVLAGQVVTALRTLLYAAYAVPGVSDLIDAALAERLPAFAAPELAYMTKLFSQTEFRLKHTAYGHLPLELAVVDAVLMRTGQMPSAQPVMTASAAPVPVAPAAVRAVPPAYTAAAPTAAPIAPTAAAVPAAHSTANSRPVRSAVVPAPSASPAPSPPPPADIDDDAMPPLVPRPDRFRRDRMVTSGASAVPASAPLAPIAPARSIAEPGATVPETGVAALTLEQVDGLWGRIKQRVKMEGRSKAFAMLLDTHPNEVRGNTVVLTTIGNHHCEYLNQDDTRLLLEKAIEEVVGQPVRVVCELHQQSSGSTSSPRTSRPSRSTGGAGSAPPAPLLFEPPMATRAATVVPSAAPSPAAPKPATARQEGRAQRLGNLFDAQTLDPEDAPPFPDER